MRLPELAAGLVIENTTDSMYGKNTHSHTHNSQYTKTMDERAYVYFN